MADDEFFKRIAETQVVEPAPVDRRLGTAARRAARATTRRRDDAQEDANGGGSKADRRRRSPRRREPKADGAPVGRWKWARPVAVCVGLGAIAAVALTAVSFSIGGDDAGTTTETQTVVQAIPPSTERGPVERSPGPVPGRERTARRQRKRGGRALTDPPRSTAPTSETSQPAVANPPDSAGSVQREGFGFERGAG